MNRFTANGKDPRLVTRWNAGAIRPWQTSPRHLRSMPSGPSPAGHTRRPGHCRHFSLHGGVPGAAAHWAWFFEAAQALHCHPDLQRAASLSVNGVQKASWPRPAVRKTGQDRAVPEALHGRGQPFQTLPLQRSATRMAGISRRLLRSGPHHRKRAVRAPAVSVPPQREAARAGDVRTAAAVPAADRRGFARPAGTTSRARHS